MNYYDWGNGAAAGRLINWGKKEKPRAARRTRQEIRSHFTAYLDLWKEGTAPVKLEFVRPATVKLYLDMSRPAASFTTFTFSVNKALGIDADIRAEPDLDWELEE